MGSPCPPHWSFAERAAYFGDRMCAFCGHRNPGGARFCNDCASPLHLKPCEQCDGINDQAATNCHKCGAALPLLPGTSEAMRAMPASYAPPAETTTGDVEAVTPIAPQPLAASAPGTSSRLLSPGQFLVTAIAMMVAVASYDVYRVNVAKRDATGVAPEPVDVPGNNAITAIPAAPVVVESMPLEPERFVGVQPPIPTTEVEPAQRATARRGQAPVQATIHANAHRRPAPAQHAPVRATPPVPQGYAVAPVGARVAQTSEAVPPDPWRLMQASLASCDGDLFARIVCDQRVRRHFCEGHWGEAPHCASAIANEHGQ